MTTARDLIKSSMRLATIIASGEEPTADETVDGLKVLNDLLESWSTERLTVWRRENEVFTLSAGVATYTIGPAGAFSTTRPIRVGNSYATIGEVSYPIEVWPQDQYDMVAVKATGGIPERMVYTNEYPLGVLTFYQVPAQDMTLHLASDKLLPFPLTLTTTLAFPPGYERALRFALAINLAPEYGIVVPPDILDIAKHSKANIKRANRTPRMMTFDATLVDGCCSGGGSEAIISGAGGGGDDVDIY